MRESHDKAVNLSSDSRHKSGALPDAERKITHTRRANISWMHPFCAKGISIHEQPVEENVDVACHHCAIVAVRPNELKLSAHRFGSVLEYVFSPSLKEKLITCGRMFAGV